ncbi:MAG: hypothetical protein IKO26_09025 [Paludibacteraceae bacterium]|nr:hypothetical protein [Paludibacteraceae bacterium]
MVLLRKTLYIVIAILAAMPVSAKKTAEVPPSIPVEREQQFLYYWYAARHAIDEERYADAYALLEFCRMLKPDDGTTLTFLGVLYDGAGQPQLALETYRKAFETDPRDQWYKYSTALLAQHTDPGNREALRVLEQAYQAQPEDKADEDLLEQLKRLYMGSAQWKKALRIQDEQDRLRGYDGYSAVTRYRIYAMWGKPKKAIAEIDRYLENDPANVQFLLFRLEIMERIGSKREEMIAMYDKILSLDPYNVSVLNNYAYYLATHGGNLKEAERMSALTIGAEPDNPVFLDTYGWIMHLQGQNELALFYLKKALNNTDERSRAEIERHIKEAER